MMMRLGDYGPGGAPVWGYEASDYSNWEISKETMTGVGIRGGDITSFVYRAFGETRWDGALRGGMGRATSTRKIAVEDIERIVRHDPNWAAS